MRESPGREAAQRADELLRREQELAARKAITEADVRRAGEHAAAAQERDRQAHRRELLRHYEAGVTHERASEVHQRAALEGLGDVTAHRLAANREREAARHHFQISQESGRHAAAD